ncbi:type II secretion system protein GspF [Betaproteobacteria bacterium]|nr:type II secretion system protein GspF [Betaproteobacteria bacterium]GHU31272.1 type II secretion system protein GspF [Betaproteobacteria bacterium]
MGRAAAVYVYRYRAIDVYGRLVRGQAEASHPAALDDQLRQRGIELVRCTRVRGPRPSGQRIPRRELIHFFFNLEQLLDAGVPVLDALSEIGAASTHSALTLVCTSLRDEVERGHTLSAAAALHPGAFDDVLCSLLHAGEVTGDLAPVLRQIGANLSRAEAIKAHAMKAAIYPAIVAVVLGVAVAVALTVVVPQLAILFQSMGETLPLATRVLLGLADWLGRHGWLLPPLGLLTLLAITLAAARSVDFRRTLHAIALRLPLIGPIHQRLTLARVASLLGTLYASGITLVDALASTAKATPNLVIRAGVENARAYISTGSGIAAAFEATGLFPQLVSRMLRVGEHSGRLDTALNHLANFYEHEASAAIARLEASIEPLLTVAMGIILLWIVFAILSPVYDILTRLPL